MKLWKTITEQNGITSEVSQTLELTHVHLVEAIESYWLAAHPGRKIVLIPETIKFHKDRIFCKVKNENLNS